MPPSACTVCCVTTCPAVRCAPGWSLQSPSQELYASLLVSPSSAMFGHSSPARISLHFTALCSALPGSSRVLGFAAGKAAASPVGHRQLPNLALHSPRGWSWAMSKLRSPWREEGLGVHPYPSTGRLSLSGQAGPCSWVGGRLPRQGVQALAPDCAPRGTSRAACKWKSTSPGQICGAGWAPGPVCCGRGHKHPSALLQLSKASAVLAKSPVPCMEAGFGWRGQGGCWCPP